MSIMSLSPSSQRVWIEIIRPELEIEFNDVALFTEGVDWNKIPPKYR